MSPTQRSIAKLKKMGYRPAIVERWNQFAHIRQDLYGFIDILAIKPGEPILAIQACVVGDMSKRLKKIAGLPAPAIWLATGSPIQIWGWGKHGQRGKRKLWDVTVKSIFHSTLQEG